MDGGRFDDLARSIAGRASRRDVLRALIGGGAVTIGGWAGLRGGGSRAQEGAATPEIPTVEPVEPTVVPPEPTQTPLIEPTVDPTSTPLATSTSTPVPPREQRGTATPTARPAEKGAAPAPAATRTLSLSVTAGPVRTSVRADARGFAANEAIELRWHTGATFRVLANLTASAGGRVVKTFEVPNSPRGDHRVRAQGTGGRADAIFTVKQSTKLSPASGLTESTTKVSLRGFRANTPMFVFFYPTDQRTGTPVVLAQPMTSSTGSATVTVTIPAGAAAAKHRVEGKEANSGTYTGTFFTVTAEACRTTGAVCDVDGQCCSGDCVAGTCLCSGTGIACDVDDECCGICNPSMKTCCKPESSSCESGFLSQGCCPGLWCHMGLSLGICRPCVPVGGACTLDAACCGNQCKNSACCVGEGGSCSGTVDCCTGTCRRAGGVGPRVCVTDVIGG